MKRVIRLILYVFLCGVVVKSHGANATILGWNNLGMHCMDSDYSVFSILPPYNTIEAQLIVNGKLITNGTSGYTVTYHAVPDPSGSTNSTSIGKTTFYDFASVLYGAVAPDMGLAGWGMPGLLNTPQAMLFENANVPAAGVSTPVNWFRAEGIPITPYDDAKRKNEYPLMRLTARDPAKNIIATSDVVLPVSDEMDCRACHASGTTAGAKPLAGWVNDSNPERDYRLNILRLHDELQTIANPAEYAAALAGRGFNPSGLYANVVQNGRPVLCAACHASEALGTTSFGNIPPLTASMHRFHAHVIDPVLNITLDNSLNRAACYRCHPGSTTRCLRGAMGNAVAADGSMEMQCQSCHGNMSQVGSPNRVGWFMEPNCQSCHSGTATHNNGQIRYTSVFTDNLGTVRQAVDNTFATSTNTPVAGLSLYRFSKGHGGLQCSACHGSTHAEFPSSGTNDNLRNIQLQGHAGVTAECTACHTAMPNTTSGGPHGMHPTGASWVSAHHDAIHSSSDRQKCAACHGADFRGTVLSRASGPRTLTARFDGGTVTLNLFQGAIVGCYTCHNGPNEDNLNTSAAPVAQNTAVTTSAGRAVVIVLPISGAGAVARIISQPVHGTVGLTGSTATYFPEDGFVGADSFTFAAYDGAKNSALATGSITVTPPSLPPSITTQPVSRTVSAGSTISFSVVATGTAPLSYQWRKGTANISGATNASLTLTNVALSAAGNYSVVVTNVAGSTASAIAVLTVNPLPVQIALTSPADGASYSSTATVPISANVTPAGSATRVQFFDGSTLLGTDRTVPYSMGIRGLSAGIHAITARATTTSGIIVTSAPVRLNIVRSFVVAK